MFGAKGEGSGVRAAVESSIEVVTSPLVPDEATVFWRPLKKFRFNRISHG